MDRWIRTSPRSQPIWTTLILVLIIWTVADGFNLDDDRPLFKYGPPNSYFGYAVAQHFIRNEPFVLVGAPKDSGLGESNETGAFYSCKFNTYSKKLTNGRGEDDRWCRKAVLERLPAATDDVDPISADGTEGRWTIKTDAGYPINGVEYGHSWFGATIGAATAGPGTANRILVCAPTLVLDTAAFTDGSCFLLNNELRQVGAPLRDCKTDDKKQRHNSYGVCEQGFSAVLSEKYETIVTGLPGVVRWTGGAVARDLNELTNYRDTKRRVGPGAVESSVKSHSYFGYSVNVGRFGFPYETVTSGRGANGNVLSLVFGSPRYNDTGAVFFGKFHKDPRSLPVDQINDLKIIQNFHLGSGDLIGSGFGYTIAVGDINQDGLDDLLVGSPYYFNASSKHHRGGAVFVYFASGQAQGDNFDNVFLPPVKLFGPAGSNFGTSISFLGDINEDNYQDFAIGAPFTEQGGTVYIYLGGNREDFLNSPITPIQVIHGVNISTKSSSPITSFGWSLAGGSDLDGNGYPDLVVGAFMSSAAVILRTRPIIHVKADVVKRELAPIDKDTMMCGDGTDDVCFSFHTVLSVTKTKGYNVDLSSNLFRCRLEVLHYETAAKRAFFWDTRTMVKEWACGQDADKVPQKQPHRLRLQKDNSDWLNPLRFRFVVSLTPEHRRFPTEGEPVPSLSRHPVLDKRGAEYEFLLPFNKKCGNDNECWGDLKLDCRFLNLMEEITPSGNVIYVKQSGTGRTLDLVYTVTNAGERAYESILNITYDADDIEDLQLLGNTNVRLKTALGESPAVIALGNPLQENETVTFTVQFTISQSKAGGLLVPLKFYTEAVSSSRERNPDDNVCIGEVKVIKQVDAQFSGHSNSTKPILYYGGKVMGESAIRHIDDIGQEVFHVYTLTNKGPWVINNARVVVDFPYETWSCKDCGVYHGKWALYVTAEPQVEVSIPGEGIRIKRTCRVEDSDGINPLKLTVEAAPATNNGRIVKRSVRDDEDDTKAEVKVEEMEGGVQRKFVLGRYSRELRVKPKPVPHSTTYYVRISCADDDSERTANCLRVSCYLDSLTVNSAASVRIRASLWNSTFVEDYRDVEYVVLESKGKLVLDPTQAIELLDPSQVTARAETRAQPDIPRIPDKRRIPIWIIVVSIIGGIFLLFLITLLFWKCGFFERRRDPNQPLYTAQYKHGEDLDDN